MNGTFSSGNLAVITGAASGIGKAAALALANKGMRIVLVDANAEKLPAATSEVQAALGEDRGVAAFPIDVSDRVALQTMADRVLRDFGPPAFLMNNAAIHVHGGPGGIFDPIDNWRRIFDINLFGILNGISAFVPAMIDAGRPGMVVNTGSKQGLTHPPGNPAYNTVKAAVNAYTMNLARDLRERDGQVSAHLLVPGWTTTGDNEHRPGAWKPEQVIDYMLERLDSGDFYIICPDDETSTETDNKRFQWQAADIWENRPALSRWHPDYKDAFDKFMSET